MHQRNAEFHTPYPLVVGKVEAVHALPFLSSIVLLSFLFSPPDPGFPFLPSLLLNVPILFITLPAPH